MTAPIQLLVSVNGGSYISGAQQAAFTNTVAMHAASTFGFSSIKYEIYDYPPGMSVPAGWSTDAGSGAYYYQPTLVTTAPPTVTLPGTGTNNWGPLMLRVRGNSNPLRLNPDGSPNASFNPAWTDETSMVWIPSPVAGQKGIGFGETNQRDPMRGFVGALMQSLRAVDAGGGGGGSAFPTFDTHVAADAGMDLSANLTSNQLVSITGQTASRTVVLPVQPGGSSGSGQLVVAYAQSATYPIVLDGGCIGFGGAGEFYTVAAGKAACVVWFGSGPFNQWFVLCLSP